MAFTPLRTIDELEQRGIEPDRCFRVRTARVIAADYPQLQADFPQLRVAALGRAHRHLRSLRGRRQEAAVREIIDAWLVRHGGLVTSTQAGQTAINARPEIYPEVVPVHRPPRYGRAVVVSIADSNRSLPEERRSGLGREPDGLLDLKGVGVAPGVALTRRRRLHGLTPLGLCPLGFALSEYSWRLMLDAVFRHAGTEFRALPIYAVIDLGFDDFLGRPAGVLVRRAHRRHPGGHDFFHQIGATTYRIPVMAEMLLRCYGVTTARAPAYVHFEGRGPGRRAARFIVDGQRLQNHTPAEIGELLEVVAPGRRRASFLHLNLQNTSPVQERPPAAQFFDLEVVGASRRFDEPVLMMVGNRPFRWGGTLGPRNAHFIQPDRRYALPLADWGPARATSKELRSLGLPRRSWCAAPLLFGMQLARALRAGTISPARVADRVHGRVERARRRWPRTSDAWRQSFRAADALFESAATTGTRVLGIERDRAVRSSLNAAEGLVAIVDLQTARATATSALTDRHRVHWAARRIMASDAIQRAEGRMTRDAARALRAGDAVTARRLTASLEAGARLRDPASRSIPDLRRDLARLMRAEPVAACVASWLASVRRASRR